MLVFAHPLAGLVARPLAFLSRLLACLFAGLLALFLPFFAFFPPRDVLARKESDVRFIRRMRRDVAERNRTAEEVAAQFLGTVKPMHDLFVTPSKVCAREIES